MHLSLLSDAYLSDSIDDGARPIFLSRCGGDADGHFQGLLRGVAFAAVLAFPLVLTSGAAWLHRLDVASQVPVHEGQTVAQMRPE